MASFFIKYLYRDILYVKACGCYCDLYFRDKKRITVARSPEILLFHRIRNGKHLI